ncbi:SRF-TF-domain-containing protein [Auricularia subglabra TFB-10046 SS5]|uniref:SRF-TF-domain-containing protein n=1 Tax=Auricularia subglabra (strain TFB-10046 / SS5) TaxID=717982 RepID=J0LDS3_AURST|nr:SRF-TF-domain-containing protein [Auricularia subglabra TFB-10046 SS5]
MSYRPTDLPTDDFDPAGPRKRPRPGDLHAPAAPGDELGFQHEEPDEDGEDEDEDGKDKKAGRRKIKIEFIQDKSRRHITFSKRKAGIMKKAYELSTLTGTQVLLLVVSETGLVYTFTTAKLQPLVTQPEGKNLIQACLNAPSGQLPSSMPVGQTISRAGPQRTRGAPSTIAIGLDKAPGVPDDLDDGEGSHSTSGASPVNAPRQPQPQRRDTNGSPQQGAQPYPLSQPSYGAPPPHPGQDSLPSYHPSQAPMLPYHLQHPHNPTPWAVPQQQQSSYPRR